MVKSPINTLNPMTIRIKVRRMVNKPVIRPVNIITQADKFIPQVYRKDVLANMLSHTELGGEKLFQKLITDNNVDGCHADRDRTRQGWIFESICQISMTMKLIENLDYTQIYRGQPDNLTPISSFKTIMDVKVNGGGGNIVDYMLKQTGIFVPFSIKYMDEYNETDICKISRTMEKQNVEYNVGLIVKDKKIITGHRFNHKTCVDKQDLDNTTTKNLLFDEKDIVKSLQMFCDKYKNVKFGNIDDFIEHIDETYLLTTRKQLILRTHQKMTIKRFENDIDKNENKMFCIAHKPRSGKSITMLSICDSLLETGRKRILMMTSVPATIKSFTDDLDQFIAFRNIKYKTQDEFDTIDDNFVGVVLCSTQFLKTKSKTTDKKALVKMMDFDVIITDESHFGSSTEKTKTDIIDEDVVDAIMKNKVTIFASGTPDKTKKFYGIKSSYVYEWETTDESHMKTLFNEPRNEFAIEYMSRRHGPMFMDCYNDATLDRNYQRCPSQVLLKHTITDELVKEINDYNIKNNTKYGYSCGSLLELSKKINKDNKNGYEYENKFALCESTDGEEILIGFFDGIISKNRMKKDTIIKQVEAIQTRRNSRVAKKGNPSLIIIYLPTHTGNNNILKLQQTLKTFLENIWTEYNIEYSNATEESNHGLDEGTKCKEYNNFIDGIMANAKKHNKKGCVLLLGNKGGVGITYKHCDVTISLDDGHNLDQQKQRYSRALTEGDGKTIGINIDMNIQRTYTVLSDIIHNHRKNTNTKMTNAEILYYLHKENIFTFDPQHINNGQMREVEILSYYDKVSQEMMSANDDVSLLEGIECNDEMRDYINIECFKSVSTVLAVNPVLEGEQQDCPKGDKTKIIIDTPNSSTITPVTVVPDTQNQVVEEEKIVVLINKTLGLCKTFLFPLLALISRTTGIKCFKEILVCEKTSELVKNLLIDKKIDLENDNYRTIVQIMNVIIDQNAQIVNDITEIYSHAAPHKLRGLIEKHFIPTNEEKKNNAEIPTPVCLVDEMLNKIPEEFWTTPQKVFEPCCGKGNFVLGIFDKFYDGLKEKYIDEIERCKIIMTECLYYADLTTMNIFITTEILKCHIQSYTGLEELDYKFNSYTGDTLQLNTENIFKIDKFNAVIGNPPYNASGAVATGSTIWQKFTVTALNKWVIPKGYLLFVHPSGWRKPNTKRGKLDNLYDLMAKENQLLYLEIHGINDGKKVFNCGTRYDWYLIEHSKCYRSTVIVDEEYNKLTKDLSTLNWLPNSNIEDVINLLATGTEVRCPVMYSTPYHGALKKQMSYTNDETFKYPCVHSTLKNGTRFMFSTVNDKGHFGSSKVIIGESGINTPVVDINGDYGMTQGSFAIEIENEDEGNKISKALQSVRFNKIMKSTMFSIFRIDWNVFKEFKKDFWVEFIEL